jgi:hypothetical protein
MTAGILGGAPNKGRHRGDRGGEASVGGCELGKGGVEEEEESGHGGGGEGELVGKISPNMAVGILRGASTKEREKGDRVGKFWQMYIERGRGNGREEGAGSWCGGEERRPSSSAEHLNEERAQQGGGNEACGIRENRGRDWGV